MSESIRLFLCGDVMTGRGIDHILPHSSPPQLYERHVGDARAYVKLAERAHGPLPRPVEYGYIWGDALEILDRYRPDLGLINLETAVTTSDAHWQGKGIHYRMHPGNLPCLTAADVRVCSLANNHVLDWGFQGLKETLDALQGAGIQSAGAGVDADQASRPAALEVSGERQVSIFAWGMPSSGIPPEWSASRDRAGVQLMPDASERAVNDVISTIQDSTSREDLVLVSLHWGGNWGYRVPDEQRRMAHRLIQEAGVDLIHGHSSHHVKGIEVYEDRLILYGCGDFINDYEGIQGHERFRGDLAVMYFPELDPESGHLLGLEMVPLQRRKLSLQRAEKRDVNWLGDVLNREGRHLATHFQVQKGEIITWDPQS